MIPRPNRGITSEPSGFRMRRQRHHDDAHPRGREHQGIGACRYLLYDLYKAWGSMGEIAVSQARKNLAEVIETTQLSGEPIVLTHHGRWRWCWSMGQPCCALPGRPATARSATHLRGD